MLIRHGTDFFMGTFRGKKSRNLRKCSITETSAYHYTLHTRLHKYTVFTFLWQMMVAEVRFKHKSIYFDITRKRQGKSSCAEDKVPLHHLYLFIKSSISPHDRVKKKKAIISEFIFNIMHFQIWFDFIDHNQNNNWNTCGTQKPAI